MANTSTCARPWQAVSNGVFQGNMPIDYALPLLILQITLVLLLTRAIGLLFSPLRQPRVVAEIVGGVLLGPSALGRNKQYMKKIFPEDSMSMLDSMANLGLLYFLFMVGMEVDLREIRRSGKTALSMALAGICLPFVATVGVALLVQKHLLSTTVGFAPLVVFMGVPLSITAFPVLARIMAERRLLKTDLGRLVLPVAAINDICAWVLLAVGVALSGPKTSPFAPALFFICGAVFGVLMLTLVRRLMTWVAKEASKQDSVSEVYVSIALLGVLLCGFITDAIGIHPLFGAFIFGLVVPKESSFTEMLIQKMEDFVTILLIPLFFASSGLKTNLSTMSSPSSIGFLLLFLTIAAVGKITGTVLMARITGRSNYRENLTLGFLMNTKGLAELVVLNIGKDLKVLDDQLFAILVLTCLLTTFMTMPAVVALYEPAARNPESNKNRKFENTKDELRIMACLHGTRNVPSIIALIQATAAAAKMKKMKPSMKVFVVRLVELSQRPFAIMLGPKKNRLSNMDRIFLAAFETFAQLSRVVVKTLTVTSDLADMHQAICEMAAEKRVNMIVLPFHKCFRRGAEGGDEMEPNPSPPRINVVNQKVLSHAPCSVAVFVDRGFGEIEAHHNIAVLFLGGPDDREALAYGARLAEGSSTTLSLVRFLPASQTDHIVVNIAGHLDNEKDKSCDEEAVELYRGHNYEEVITQDPVEAAEVIAKSGRRRGPGTLALETNLSHSGPGSSPELGLIGEALLNLSPRIPATTSSNDAKLLLRF